MVLDPHWAGNCLYTVSDPSFQAPGESHNQGLASKTRLNGVSVAQRKRVNPPRWANQRMNASTQPQAGAESRFNTAKATPPRINALATTSLADIRSERNTTPPKAARTGTRSCATAAWVVVRPLSALYQRTYPSPDVMTPDINASAMPSGAR